jgi:hypothetical protein
MEELRCALLLAVTGAGTWESVLVKHELQTLFHVSSPFYSGYFGDGVSHLFLAALSHDLPIFSFPSPVRLQACTTMPSTFPLRWGFANFFVSLSGILILLIPVS